MLHNWAMAKARRQSNRNQSWELKTNPKLSRSKEIAVMLKGPDEVKIRPDKVYTDEASFLEIESSLDEEDVSEHEDGLSDQSFLL